MKDIIKLTAKYILFGISYGCTFLVLICLCLYTAGGKDFLVPIFEDFARQAIGAMAVGVACGGTAVIYHFDRPCGFAKFVIHFCIGMGVFYPTAIHLGWIPFHPDQIPHTILQFLFSCGIFMAIWFCFYLFNRKEAKQINERLRKREHEHNGRKTKQE